MDIKLYKFKKRTNSTKQPSPDSANTFACTINEDCSINNPVVRIKAPDTFIDLVTKTVSNQSIVHITDGASGQPCPSVVANIDYTAQGVTGATMTRAGKNFLQISASSGEVSGITYTVYSDGTISASGRSTEIKNVNIGTAFLPIGTYILSGCVNGSSNTYRLQVLDSNGGNLGLDTGSGLSFSLVEAMTVSVRIQIRVANLDINTIFSPMIMVNDTDSTYVPYTIPTTYTADFGRTIYGGNYDFVSGILTEDTDSNGDPISPPNVYNLTGQTITTAQGVNNFYADTGAILTFTYKAYEQSSNMKIWDLNYAYIPSWHRYYFVSQVIYELGTWVFVLRCDVLATYKNEIGNSSHYIERCAYEFDGDIIDGLYPEKTNPILTIVKPDKPGVGVPEPTLFGQNITPTYIVGIIGGIAPENVDNIAKAYNGSVVYFALEQDQLGDFINLLLDSVDLYNIDPNEISYDLQKQLINPIQYLESIICVPFGPNVDEFHVAKKFYLGFQYLDVPYAYDNDPKTGTTRSWKICKAPTIGQLTINNGYMHKNQVSIKLPVHPDYKTRGHWLCSNPASKYVFTCEPFGQIEIPSCNILQATVVEPQNDDPYIELFVTSVFDISSGDTTLFLSWSSDVEKAFIMQTRNCAVPVPVHQSVQDVMTFRQDMRALGFQAIEGAFGLVKSAVSAVGPTQEVSNTQTLKASSTEYDIGGPIGSAINTMDKMMKTIDDASMANQVKISGNSAHGSYMSYNRDLLTPRVFCYFTPLADEHNEERGKPLCAVRQLSTIPGYILCSGAEIETYGTAEENNAIASFLNGGFYYE